MGITYVSSIKGKGDRKGSFQEIRDNKILINLNPLNPVDNWEAKKLNFTRIKC